MPVISGQPAIIYRRDKLEIVVTPMELLRMVLQTYFDAAGTVKFFAQDKGYGFITPDPTALPPLS